MPIIKSSIKRARQNLVRRARLLPYRTHVKTMLRRIADLATTGKKDEARTILPAVYKAIDMAMKKQIIHRNNAARKKSLAARLVK